MSYRYTKVSNLLEDLGNGWVIGRDNVTPRVLQATVWQAVVSSPGCLGDAYDVSRSRESALGSVEYWMDEEREFSARTVRGRLRRHGICYLRDGRVITLGTITISDLF